MSKALHKDFYVQSLPENISNEIRSHLVDDFKNELKVERAQSTRSICRSCLKRFQVGDERILFLYNPYDKITITSEIGPIFIHSKECTPAGKDICSTDVLTLPLLLQGFNNDGQTIKTLLLTEDKRYEKLCYFVSQLDIVDIQIRDAEFGCFITKLTKEPRVKVEDRA